MKQTAKFSRSKVENLFRHRAGNYYAVVKVDGKIRRQSLQTDDYNLAKERLAAVLEDLRGATAAKTAGTLRAAIVDEAHRDDATLKQTTKHYYQQIAKSLLLVSDTIPSRPADKALPRVTLADLRPWLDKYAALASRTRYNGALALLRRTYQRSIEARQITRNLPDDLSRLNPIVAHRDIPSAEEFAIIVEEIASQRKRSSKATAAVVRLLAATGLRISEAQALRWKDISEDALTVRTAKNDALRRVPLTGAARTVLLELRKLFAPEPDSHVMPIRSPRIALENACERLKLPHLRVHDLRHIFATRCIEAGVDLPTIASWLGHRDGGILAAKTYGHVISRHSDTQIKKVQI
ncbi:MAG: site-specific integrase [Akkermansiaceae bacterium]|nr:site-specific integrase [Akkermansiaceae bacterium]